MKELLAKFSPRNTSCYFWQTSILFDPTKSTEEAALRAERCGIETTIDDMRKIYLSK